MTAAPTTDKRHPWPAHQKSVEVKLDYELSAKGEAFSSVFIVVPVLREIRAQEAAEGPEDTIPSPWIRTPGGQLLSNDDLGDLLGFDFGRIAAAIADFATGQRPQAGLVSDPANTSTPLP